MIENVVQNIGGVGVFGIISVCIFFFFFTGMLLWAGRLKKNYLKTMCSLPLEADGIAKSETNSNLSEPHE